MPIKSTKPSQRGPYKGTPPKPPMSSYALESQITDTTAARRQLNEFNGWILQMTQPYERAAELRAGWAFKEQQDAAMWAEKVGDAPYRGLGSTSMGTRRRLPDVGP